DAQTMLSVKRVREHGKADLPEFRLSEEATKGPSSIWKLYYQGSVGGQALTGMPVVSRIRTAHGERARIWPFETGWKPLAPSDLDGVEAVFAEVYPTLFAPKAGAGQVKDEVQVRAVCERLNALDDKGQLGALFGPAKDDARRGAVENEEGWILGVSA